VQLLSLVQVVGQLVLDPLHTNPVPQGVPAVAVPQVPLPDEL
jgi:hypothetical protein